MSDSWGVRERPAKTPLSLEVGTRVMATWLFRSCDHHWGLARMRDRAALIALMLACATAANAAQTAAPPTSEPRAQTTEPAADPTPPNLASASATLADTGASLASRHDAATMLLGDTDDALARSALLDAMRRGAADPRGRLAVLRALGDSPVPPSGLWHAVVQLALTETDPSLLVEVLDAAASFRTRAAAQLLLGFTADDQPPQIREMAYEGLARLSGRVELARDGQAWQRWLLGVIRLTERQWHRELIRGLTGRIDFERTRRTHVAQRLVETYRRLWLGTPAEERSTMLAELLVDPIPDLRALGFDLVRAELASAHPLLPVVHEAVLGLLASDDWRVRADAAVLVGQLAPQNAGDRVLAALRAERDPRAAEALLTAIARWPSEAARETVIVWLERDGATAKVATQAVWALQRKGLIDSDADKNRVLDALRFLELDQINGAGCRLLVALGDQTDRQRVVGLLTSESAPLRLAAAEALAVRADALDAIAAAANTDRALVAALVRGIRQHRLNAAGFALLASIQAIPDAQRREHLTALAREMSTDDLISAGEPIADAAFREEILALLLDPQRRPADDAPEARRGAYAGGLAALVEARIGLGRHDPAIAAIEALKSVGGTPEQVASLDRLIAALLDADRLDDAMALGGAAPLWLDQLQRLVAKPLGAALADAITERFAALTPEQVTRFDALKAQLPTEVTDAEPATPPPTEAPDEDEDG